MLNRVLALRKIDKKRKRGFAPAQSRGNKEGIATARSSAVAVAIELWLYFSLNGEGGDKVL